MTWCWQVPEPASCELYTGGYLFSTLYRLYRSGYRGNGLYITPNAVSIPREFKELFLALPLDVQQNITNRIWNGGEEYNEVIVRNNHPVIPLSLRFLFAIYGRLKSATSLVVPAGTGMWKGDKISRTEYRFVFGAPDLRARPLIPDFMDQKPMYTNPIDFRMICL